MAAAGKAFEKRSGDGTLFNLRGEPVSTRGATETQLAEAVWDFISEWVATMSRRYILWIYNDSRGLGIWRDETSPSCGDVSFSRFTKNMFKSTAHLGRLHSLLVVDDVVNRMGNII